ncbi:MAG TPA: DUF3039 domain-containing protein [Acidimicrobiia bacterium]
MSTAIEPRPAGPSVDDPDVHHLALGRPVTGRTYKALCGHVLRARPEHVAKRLPGCPMCYERKARIEKVTS